MSFNGGELLDDEQAKMIIYNMVAVGIAGFFSWEIENQEFHTLEKITGRTLENIRTLPEMIKEIAFEKDRELALQDLDDFLMTNQNYYESTFRIIDADNKIRWVFFKGTLMPGNQLGGIIYDVSEKNFKPGHAGSTNLINTATFMRKLKNAINHAETNNQKGALLYIDISSFHTFINKHGFEFVNAMIYKVGRALLKCVGPKDELGHFLYDRFMFLLNDIDDLEQVEQFSREIFNIFEEPFIIEGHKIYLKINMSITVFPKYSSDADELMRFSDSALSQARKNGLDEPVFFDSNMMDSYNREIEIESELSQAIIEQELYLVYQPQLELKTNKIIGFEALLRWKNKNLGFVSPSEFIPVAEDKGYIVSIGRWVRKESIKIVRHWLEKGIDIEKMSVNVSSIEILHKGFKNRLLKLCEEYNVEPQRIELEITERTMISANEANKDIVNELSAAGFKIALDDYGVGYSNLSSLMNFEINTLKLDKSFIDNINDERQLYILKNILASKNYLYQHITAEGVEDARTMQILSDLGFDSIQGYHFSKPLTKSAMERFIFDFKTRSM